MEERLIIALKYYYGIEFHKDEAFAIKMINDCAEEGMEIAAHIRDYYKYAKQGDKLFKCFKFFNEYLEKNKENQDKAVIELRGFIERKVGKMYESGEGVKKDIKMAIEFYERSIEKGNLVAMVNLGLFLHSFSFCSSLKTKFEGFIYDEGTNKEVDYEKAIKYYLMAAEKKYSTALHNLALMYEEGNGVEKDYFKALEYYKAAAEGGNSNSLINIGYMLISFLILLHGFRLSPNHKKGTKAI